jgi:L-amino acid N-acyltransferase YncA
MEIMPYIFSKNKYVFVEFDFKNLRMDWENPYSIIFEKYDEKDYKLLDDTLKSIETIERPFTMDEVNHRLETGHMLFIAKKNNKIIGFFWVATNYIEVPYFHASMHLNKEEAVDYNSYMVEEYRGKRINSALKAYAFENLKQKGYKRVFGYIKTTNKSSLRANELVGFRTIGRITAIIIMTLEFRYHSLSTDKIVFHGGPLRLWKGLFRKVKDKYCQKKRNQTFCNDGKTHQDLKAHT